MDFSRKKLPKEAADKLRICPIRTVKPFALMLSPVYVFMKANEKFVSVKAPLDFFTSEELERLKPFENFHLPEFIDSALPFRQAARSVLALLSWQPKAKEKPGAKKPETAALAVSDEILPPAPYELSDAVLRMIGPLWGAGANVEPFFVAVFANELCELLPGGRLKELRDRDVDAYERGVLRSSWAVFLALHLGFCDLGFLNRLRMQVFEQAATGVDAAWKPGAIGRSQGEIDELVDAVYASLDSNKLGVLRGDFFLTRPERAAQKIAFRLNRVKKDMIRADLPAPTIFGQKGFVDV